MYKACRHLLFFDLRLMYVRKRVWTASGPRFGTHLGSQNRSQIDLEAIWKGIGFWISTLRRRPSWGESDLHPGTPTPVAGYICTRISHALRARSSLLGALHLARGVCMHSGTGPCYHAIDSEYVNRSWNGGENISGTHVA